MPLSKEVLEEIKKEFKRVDVDKTGYITKENLKQVHGGNFHDKKADAVIKMVDKNGDGKLSLEEIIKFVELMSTDIPRFFITSSVHGPLPRNKRVLLKFLSRQNASKFAIFL